MSGTIGNILAQESFDWMTTNTPLMYRNSGSGTAPTITTGIYGIGKCWQTIYNLVSIFSGVTAHSSGFFCGHLKIQSSTTGACGFTFLQGSSVVFGIRFNIATNAINIVKNNEVIAATTPLTIKTGNWYWFNIKYIIADSGGEITLRLDNNATTDVVSYTGDTLFDTPSTVTSVTTSMSNADMSLDNLIMYEPGTYISERRMTVQRATGDSAYKSDFVPSTGSDNYAMIDETNTDLADYNSSTTVGNIDLFTRATVPLASVDSISYCSLAAKTDAGARSLSHIARVSSTDYESSAFALSASPLVYETRYPVNPNTNTAWAVSEINSTEFGYKDQA